LIIIRIKLITILAYALVKSHEKSKGINLLWVGS